MLAVRCGTTLATAALLLSGCGLLAGGPAVRGPADVQAALDDVREGARLRVAAALALDAADLRRFAAADPDGFASLAARAALPATVDAIETEAAQLAARLDEQALLVAGAADGSRRAAAEHRGEVWADLRLAPGAASGQVVTDTAGPPDAVDALVAQSLQLLGAPDDGVAAVDLLTEVLAAQLLGAPDRDVVDRRALADALLVVDDIRQEETATFVTIGLDIASARSYAASVGDEVGVGRVPVTDLLERLPDRLDDVGTLRFTTDGVLRQLRLDLTLVAASLEGAVPGPDLGPATGLFLLVDVESVGEDDALLLPDGDAVPPNAVVELVGLLPFPAMTGFDGITAQGDDGDPTAGSQPTDAPDAVGGGDRPDDDDGEDGEDEEPEPSATGQPDGSAPGLRPTQLDVGDCFDDEGLFGTAQATTVDCAQPHDNEAFATVRFDVEDYEELTRNEPDAVACIEQFEAYVGVAYSRSELVVDVLRPSEDEFDAGARTTVCYLYASESLTGSVRDSGR